MTGRIESTAYDEAVACGLTIDGHASDLYVEDGPVARILATRYDWCKPSKFIANVEPGEVLTWWEFPFQWAPHWREWEAS